MHFFETKIEFLKGVGPQRALSLQKELSIFTFGDLLQHYPFRYEDRSVVHLIKDVREDLTFVQVKAKVQYLETVGEGAKKRLVAHVSDGTGEMELVWFRASIRFVEKYLEVGQEYIFYGKPSLFNYTLNMAHPEFETLEEADKKVGVWQPVYNTTEGLRNVGLDSKGIYKLIINLLDNALPHISESLPNYLKQEYQLISKAEAVKNIHIPLSYQKLEQAKFRLKFEELFFVQWRILGQKSNRQAHSPGFVFKSLPLVNQFYKEYLPFELTNAQKRVIREIYQDLGKGKQMNRLVQGDVGSGKTIVAFISMLMAIDNQHQACLMAPTEILADQHFVGLKPLAENLGLNIAKLTGSTKKKDREKIHQELADGSLHFLVGTHALLEDVVQFKSLGVCVIDEQHRFGVAQRAKLWAKNNGIPPHILVMTATPIPRTLAMTLYGDLDVSVIDEMPAGRKPIKTVHRYDSARLAVFGFIREEIKLGRQVYIVYPLIEESQKLDLKDLLDGYESLCRAFPEYQLSIVHGKMKPADKDFEMQRFVKNETQIMVATTVIEVGVNVPNASVMVIENAERFGLAQLHQLRGRVGRGAEQSYCILMTSSKLSKDSKTRIETMVNTNNGFEIADVDLKLRGPGDLMGTKQSGLMDLLITDLASDGEIVKIARESAEKILESDPQLLKNEHACIKTQIASQSKNSTNWARIS